MVDHENYYCPPYFSIEEVSNNQQPAEEEDTLENDSLITRDDDEFLISLVQRYPYLYNNELKDFKDPEKKEYAWHEIAVTMKKDVVACQKRWQRLRERYSREKKAQETEEASFKRKAFILYENMSFLEPFVKRRRAMSKVRRNSSYNMTNQQYPDVISKQNKHSINNRMVHSPTGISSETSKHTTTSLIKKDSYEITAAGTYEMAEVEDIDGETKMEGEYLISQRSDSTQDGIDNESITDKSSLNQQTVIEASEIQNHLEIAIAKMTTVMESFITKSSATSFNPEVPEDVAFCQLILSKIQNISESKKIEVKKKILKTLFEL